MASCPSPQDLTCSYSFFSHLHPLFCLSYKQNQRVFQESLPLQAPQSLDYDYMTEWPNDFSFTLYILSNSVLAFKWLQYCSARVIFSSLKPVRGRSTPQLPLPTKTHFANNGFLKTLYSLPQSAFFLHNVVLFCFLKNLENALMCQTINPSPNLSISMVPCIANLDKIL